jgi:hypothetical protein
MDPINYFDKRAGPLLLRWAGGVLHVDTPNARTQLFLTVALTE